MDSCGSQSMRSRRTLVELNTLLLPVQSPLNPLEYLVLLAVPVESQNTVANAAALWHLISLGDLLLSEFLESGIEAKVSGSNGILRLVKCQSDPGVEPSMG